jgi:hypothetical protein
VPCLPLGSKPTQPLGRDVGVLPACPGNAFWQDGHYLFTARTAARQVSRPAGAPVFLQMRACAPAQRAGLPRWWIALL